MFTVSANSSGDLLGQLEGIDIYVPPRTEKRTTEHCELAAIHSFLCTFAEAPMLEYPLRIERRDRPDFLLSLPVCQVGIEVTEAVPQNWANVVAKREKNDPEGVVFLKRFRPRETMLASDKINFIAHGNEAGDVWEGDEPEREWANVMLDFTRQKTEKFFKKGFVKYDSNWLLIYDNWPLPAVNEEKAVLYFQEQIVKLTQPMPFEWIFIETSQHIWQVNNHKSFKFKIKENVMIANGDGYDQ